MTWHTATVPRDRLARLLVSIRQAGGVVTSSRPQREEVRVTWTSAAPR
jgi:hypothetical protein